MGINFVIKIKKF